MQNMSKTLGLVVVLYLLFMYLGIDYFPIYEINSTSQQHYTVLDVEDKYNCVEYAQSGTHFSGTVKTKLSSNLKVCDLFYFDSDIIQDAASKFLNFNGSVTFWLMSPGLVWHQGAFVTTFRISLKIPPFAPDPNSLNDAYDTINYIFMKKFDKQLHSMGPGKLLGLASLKTTMVALKGHHETRLFLFKGKLFAIIQGPFRRGFIVYIYNLETNQPFISAFEREPLKLWKIIREKNWVPLVTEDSMFIIRNLDPMHVMKCQEGDQCVYVYNQTDPNTFRFDKHALRGGTPFVLYKYPYYLGVTHSVFIHQPIHRHYTAHFTVLSVKPSFRTVYVSDAIEINNNIYKRLKGPSFWKQVKGDFIFPTSLLLENEDQCVVAAHVNDMGSMLFRWTGIKALMRKVIQQDKRQPFKTLSPYFVQNHILNTTQVV